MGVSSSSFGRGANSSIATGIGRARRGRAAIRCRRGEEATSTHFLQPSREEREIEENATLLSWNGRRTKEFICGTGNGGRERRMSLF